MAGSTTSFAKTLQAQDDTYSFTEDDLLSSGQFNQTTNVVKLDVMKNDLGGNAKKLWSIDNGDSVNDLVASNINTGWEPTANGNLIRIVDGQIELDISNALIAATAVGATPGVDNINALGAGVTISDSFTYAIKLANGTLSYATASFTLVGKNDAATILETPGGDYTVSKGDVSFLGEVPYFTNGQFTTDVDVADINGDGYADIVATDFKSSSISVLLNDGNGGFAAPVVNVVYGTFHTSTGANVADVNGDGYLDIVTADGNARTVSVLLGDGTAAFGPPTHYVAGPGYTNTVVAVDVDGNGTLDLVSSVGSAGLTSVILNNGVGFDPAVLYGAGVGRLSDLEAADMDGDGDADVVNVGVDTNTVSILFNDGNGVFGVPSIYATGAMYPDQFALADLDGDGDVDIVTGNVNSNDVSVLINEGGGAFATAEVYSAGGSFVADVDLVDMNEDGILDVVTSNTTSQNISVLLGDGNGGFGAATTYPANGDTTHQFWVGDLNADGAPDIVSGNFGTDGNSYAGTVSVFFNANTNDPYASGDLDVSDIDAGEAKFAAATPADLEGIYGDFTFDSDTGAWSYLLDYLDPDTQALTALQTEYDSLTVASFDGTDEHTITVTINGQPALI